MKTSIWIVVIIVMGFLGFMVGYAVPPFLEVGFGKEGAKVEKTTTEDLMKQYEKLYKQDE